MTTIQRLHRALGALLALALMLTLGGPAAAAPAVGDRAGALSQQLLASVLTADEEDTTDPTDGDESTDDAPAPAGPAAGETGAGPGEQLPPDVSGQGAATLTDGLSVGGPGTDGMTTSTHDGAALAAAPGVATDVVAALAEDPEEQVRVIVTFADGVEPDALQQAADRAARQAAQDVRGSSRAAISAEVGAAADEARARTVVRALQGANAQGRAEVLDSLRAGAAEDEVVDLWITNSVAGPADAETIAALAARPDVVSVSLDHEIQIPDLASEPLLPEWGLEKVFAPQTWGEHGYRGEGITVAVLDSGVDAAHPALADRYRGRDGDHSDSWFVTTGENYPTPGDGNGHGTHVAGSILGGPPGEVVGVAPDAEFIGVKILSDGGRGGESGILAGMQWVLAPGGDPAKAPDIASNSWGNPAGHVTVFWDAVHAWRAAGIVPVFAAGNSGPMPDTLGSPGDFPHSFTVGATDRNDLIADFSSRGPVVWDGVEHTKPDITAPGHQIRSAWPLASGAEYHTISGTSMATPHVSGVAALVLSANPSLSLEEVEDILVQTARTEEHMGDLPNSTYGSGIVDALAATTRAAHSGLVTGTVSGPDGPVAAELTVELGGDGPHASVSTTADPETGAYELWVPEGSHVLQVRAFGYQPADLDIDVAVGQVLDLDVTLAAAATATVSGAVTADGQPVPQARVGVVGESAAALTDAEGRYSLTVPHGTHEIRVTANGYRPVTDTLEVTDDRTHDVALTPLPGAGTQDWPQLKANPAATGIARSDLEGSSLEELWSATVPNVQFGSPVISGDSVYILSASGQLSALDRDSGELRWAVPTGSEQRGTPAVDEDSGTVYVTTGNNRSLVALDTADGSLRWSYDLGPEVPTYGAPTIVDGAVLVAVGIGDSGAVHAVDQSTGERVWRTGIDGGVFFGPAVADGLAVAASTATGSLTALDVGTGDVVWRSVDTAGERSLAVPAIADGRLYIGTSTADYTAGSVKALDLQTGEEIWRTAYGDTQGSSPVLYDDLVIIGSHTLGSVAAFDQETGERVWFHLAGTAVTSSVAGTTGGVVIGASQGREAFALDALTGERLWSRLLPASVISSPAVADELAVVAMSNGGLLALASMGQVSGTVTGPDGPVLAEVELTDAEGEPAATTTTDPATGGYEISAPIGDYTLRISSYGLSSHTQDLTLSPQEPVVVDVTLTAVGTGTVTGTVSDEEGMPLPGASARLAGTPLEPVTTDDEGRFALHPVAAGEHELVVELPGRVAHREVVTVAEGETTDVQITLALYDLAVVADHEGRLATVLREHGLAVDEVSFAQIDGTVDAYRAVVLNGTASDRADADLPRLQRIVQQAEEAGVGLVLGDQWAGSYGSVLAYLNALGEGGTVGTEYNDRSQTYLADPVPHALTGALAAEGRTPLLTNGYHGWLTGAPGYPMASLGSLALGEKGDGIGYQRRALSTPVVLLPALAATPWAGPTTTWAPAAREVFLDAVEHAMTAEFGAVEVQVTADGGPVTGTLSRVDGFEQQPVTDGEGRLLLEPGTHTVEVRAVGFTPATAEVEVTAGEHVSVELVLTGSGAGAVSGTVTDGTSGAPVSGATVTVVDEDADLGSATTGSTGGYTVDDVPAGTYTVRVEAGGYLPETVDGVLVEPAVATTVDVALQSTPTVGVIGDYIGRISEVLAEHDIPVVTGGWELTDDLSEIDVVIVNSPASVNETAFRSRLAALDDAGVSAIFTAANTVSNSRGLWQLSQYTGNPEQILPQGGLNQPPAHLTGMVDHPLFAGLPEDQIPLVHSGGEAPWLEGVHGVELADVALDGQEPGGTGVAYDVRTPDSVHLMLSGLSASFRTNPHTTWTPEARQLLLNGIRWAADPQPGQVAGQVNDAQGDPVRDVDVQVEGRRWATTTDEEGVFQLGLPEGTWTLVLSAHGYTTQEVEVTVADGETLDLTLTLEVGNAARLSGTVVGLPPGGGNSGQGDDAGSATQAGVPLEGAAVRLLGTTWETVTDADGHYQLPLVEAGEQELEVEAEGHVRTIHTFVMPEGPHVEDIGLVPSARVGVVGDSTSGTSTGRTKEFLADWGYDPVEVRWPDLEQMAELDMIVLNIAGTGTSTGWSPTEEQLAAFLDTVNRHRIPVLWLGNDARGGIRFLDSIEGDVTWGSAVNRGAVTTTVVADHPLTEGLPETFAPTDPGRWFGYFSDLRGGTTVATLSNDTGEHAGDTVAFRGRTADTVDVLLSTAASSSNGALSTRTSQRLYFTPETDRLVVNALQWALDARGLGADVRATLTDVDGTPVEGTVTVEETGKEHSARAGDGTTVVPLEPGTWTLTGSSFGHGTASVTVTVDTGESVAQTITLPAGAGASLSGTVRDEDGTPVAGARVVVHDTVLETTTDEQGRYSIPHVPADDWLLIATADGYRTDFADATVVDGQPHTQDLTLGSAAHVVVAGDRTSGSIGGFLAAHGFTTEVVAYNQIGTVDLASGEYDLLVLNGGGTAPTEEVFLQVLADAAEHDVSVVFLGQYGTGSIRHLSQWTGDPAGVSQSFRPGQMGYLVTQEHPVLEGYAEGEMVPLLESPDNQQYQSFDGWSGTMLADMVAPLEGTTHGGGLGWEFAGPGSVHLLLGSLASSSYGSPASRWTIHAERVTLQGLDWAMSARQSEIHGTVTGDGAPVEGARVVVDGQGSTRTDADGGYRLGLPAGEHTVEVSAPGYQTAERTVTLDGVGSVQLDVDLAPLARSSLTVTVVDASDGTTVPNAQVTAEGPQTYEGSTDVEGRVVLEPVMVGDYEVTVTSPGHLDATTEVSVTEEPAAVTVELAPIEVAVLGDVDGDLTGWLVGQDVAAEEAAWAELATDTSAYSVVVVNGGEPTEAQVHGLLEASDEAGTSLVVTGSYGVDTGGIRLLERYADGVTVGGHGYRDGAVGLSGFDPAHPLLAGVEDPAHVLADDSYYSWLSEHPGEAVAQLTVAGQERGTAISWSQRTDENAHVLLSFAAVTDYLGPDRGWTEDTGRVLLNALDFLGDPEAPTLETADPLVATSPVEVSGTAPGATTVQVLREEEVLAEVAPDADGAFTAEVELVEGPNVLVARALAPGGSADSEPLEIVLDTTAPELEWTPEDGHATLDHEVPVEGVATDEHAGVAEVTVQGEPVPVADDGTFEAVVPLEPGATEITVVATDELGNEVEQVRTVHRIPLDAEITVVGQGRNPLVDLVLTDPADGSAVQVTSARLQLVRPDGTVAQDSVMRWQGWRYRDQARGSGTFTLQVVIEVDGHTVLVPGPEVVLR